MDERDRGQMQSIQINFQEILKGVKNYTDIQSAIRQSIAVLKQKGIGRFGFVSGSLGNGEKTMREDMGEMQRRTEALRNEHGIPIFSSVDIFRNAWNNLDETHLPPKERSDKMKELFRGILGAGITDIFMLPGWKGTALKPAFGAIDEHDTATQLGITIHEIEPVQLGK